MAVATPEAGWIRVDHAPMSGIQRLDKDAFNPRQKPNWQLYCCCLAVDESSCPRITTLAAITTASLHSQQNCQWSDPVLGVSPHRDTGNSAALAAPSINIELHVHQRHSTAMCGRKISGCVFGDGRSIAAAVVGAMDGAFDFPVDLQFAWVDA